MVTIYSSAFTRSKGPKPETTALKQANLFLKKKQADDGSFAITNPEDYEKAIQMLEPFEDDLTVASKIETYRAAANKLREKANDETFVLSAFNSRLNERIEKAGKTYADSPDDAINVTAMVYDDEYAKIDEEIINRKKNGLPVAQLEALRDKIAPAVDKFSALTRANQIGEDRFDGSVNRESFGYFIKTDPATGKIINFSIKPIESGDKTPGFIKTDSFYGKIPVYLNAVRDPGDDNKLIAKVGNNTYVGEGVETTVPDQETTIKSKVLKLQNTNEVDMGIGESIANVFRTGDKQQKFDIKKGKYDIKITPDAFTKDLNVPPNSYAKDRNGSFYFYDNDKGWLQAPSSERLAETLGVSKLDIEQSAYFLSQSDIKKITNIKPVNLKGSPLLQSSLPSTVTNSPASFSTPSTTAPSIPTTTSTELKINPKKAPGLSMPTGQERYKKSVDSITKADVIQTA